jgi:regulatory protein
LVLFFKKEHSSFLHPSSMPMPKPKPTLRPPPDAAALRAAALSHLARYAATQAGLTQILMRRIDRWARGAADLIAAEAIEAARAAARAAVPAIVARLAETGALSDAVFAQARARSLARAGRSRRAIGAHLASRGVPQALAAEALPTGADHELAAALIHARKRRIGPFSKTPQTAETKRRTLASLARAGFAQSTAAKALGMDPTEADKVINEFRKEV